MEKIKKNEVPKEYRKDYKKGFTEFLKAFGLCSIVILILLLIFIIFN